ncbi:MAG: KGK domain-containing protein [Limnothrix sp.]
MAKIRHVRSNCSNEDVVKYDARLYTIEMLDQVIHQALSQQVTMNANRFNPVSVSIESAFKDLLKQNNILTCRNDQQTFDQSVDCEILKINSGGWKKGKIRFHYVVEITLDEEEEAETPVPESPLDDIRQSIQK